MERQKTDFGKEDVAVPQDIEKRFQHLVNEWFSFQKRAGFLGSEKEALLNDLVQPSQNVSKAPSNSNELSFTPRSSSLPTTPESHDRKTSEVDNYDQNTWNDLCNMLASSDLSPRNKKQQGNSDVCLFNREEQLRFTEKNLSEEQVKLVNNQNCLLKYEESLSKREKLVQHQQQVVAESEKEAAASLIEVQKRAAELVVEECLIQEKRQQLDVLEKQLKKTLHDMQVETESLNKHRQSVHEQELQVLAKEKAVGLQLMEAKDESIKLKDEWEKLKEEQSLEDKERKVTKEMQERLTSKEATLKSMEKELEGKRLALESLARKLNAREKLLKNIQKHSEEERIHMNDLVTKLDREKKSLEEKKADLEVCKRNMDATRENLSNERQEASQYISAADERMKDWENRLKQQEEEALQKQEFLEGLEAQVKSEQQRCHVLHTKVQKEQEKMAEDLTEQESNLRKRESILERKEEEIRKSLQKLTEKRNLADIKLKQLKEIESRTESLEDELHKRHQEHLQKVEWHTKDYQNQVEHLETIKHDLQQKSADIDRRFQEVRALKKEVRLWQEEAEKDFNNKVEEISKEGADLELQKKNLKNLQYEIERAGAKVIDHMMNLDHASTKLDTLREKLEASQQKMQMVANHISKQQKFMKERETNLGAKEQHIEALKKEWERRNEELTTKETNKESALQTKFLKENQQGRDSALKIHYTITEEKLEVSRNMELPLTPHQEQVRSSSTQLEATQRERSKSEEQAETLNLEMLQQEFARIIKERESLKVQQHELEETKNEVQDAKLTLAAQLKATKEMVVDASITAQKASRERDALEQERRRLGKAQKEIEAALLAREEKLSLDEKKLEKERQFLEEKERAMGIIYQAGQMRQHVDGVETSRIAANYLEQIDPTSGKAVLGRTSNHPYNDHDPQVHHDSPLSTAHSNPRFDLDMINLWREKECAKIEREKKMIMDEISRLHCQHHDDSKQSELKELSSDLEMTRFQTAAGAGNHSYQLFQRDLGPSLEALQLPRHSSSDVHAHDFYQQLSDEPSDGFFSGSEAAFSRDKKQRFEEVDTMQGNYDTYFEDVTPSQTRLESVMQSLVNVRQASRSRLHRTKNLLQTLPLSGGIVIAEVQQALCALTERLSLMEQMEDELADELREAYRIELPDSEGIIVDKVELLCKMEEQQTLRAEWEEDMQCQLEKISILQATSQASSCFSTPIKRTVFDRIVSPPSTNPSMR